MPDSLPPEDEIARLRAANADLKDLVDHFTRLAREADAEITRLRVEKDQGAPSGPGCRPLDQAASRLALSGVHPSRAN